MSELRALTKIYTSKYQHKNVIIYPDEASDLMVYLVKLSARVEYLEEMNECLQGELENARETIRQADSE